MPIIESTVELPCSSYDLFEILTRPTHLLELSPPDLQLELIDSPERIVLGSRLTLRGRRFGVTQTITNVVTEFEPERLIVEEQVRGPLRRMRHERRLALSERGVLLTELIDFEPPGGLLGLIATADRIDRELRPLLAYRQERLREVSGKSADL